MVTRNGIELEDCYQALSFFAANDVVEVIKLPDPETLPYDHFSPHPDIISERLQTLYKLQSLKQGICLVSASALMMRLCPRDHVNQHSFAVIGWRQY